VQASKGETKVSKRFKERYEIQEQLSKKGGRRTLLAHDLQTQMLVVIKVLSFGNDFEWEDLKLFERESEVLQSLSHPAIPRYLDHFEIETDTFIGFALVQTYIAAKSLDRYIEAGRTFSEAEIQQLAKDLLGILAYLHHCQPPVIHRDIKPSNILLTNPSAHSHGQVYLVDFGSVQTGIRKGRTITIAGTYGYMPPEQFGERSQPASDLYSLGATLIHLATGQYPGDLPQAELKLEFESMVNLSPELVDWLKWMTEPSLSRRLSSAEQALDALEHPQLNRLVQQPAGSKVRLKKDRHILEIYIPPTFGGSIQFFLFFAPIFLALNWSIIHTFQTFKVSQALPWPIALLYYGALVFSFFLLNSFGVVYLILPLVSGITYRFNQQDISTEILWSRFPIGKMTKIKLSKLEYTPYALIRNGQKPSAFIDGPKITIWAGTSCSSSRKNIWKLEYTPRHKQSTGEGTIDVPPQLTLGVGTRSYRLNSNYSGSSRLTDLEVNWLTSELNQWLDIPVDVTQCGAC